MPDIARIAVEILSGMQVKPIPGSDDVPDRQTRFDISASAKDHAWEPRCDPRRAMAAYRTALRPVLG